MGEAIKAALRVWLGFLRPPCPQKLTERRAEAFLDVGDRKKAQSAAKSNGGRREREEAATDHGENEQLNNPLLPTVQASTSSKRIRGDRPRRHEARRGEECGQGKDGQKRRREKEKGRRENRTMASTSLIL